VTDRLHDARIPAIQLPKRGPLCEYPVHKPPPRDAPWGAYNLPPPQPHILLISKALLTAAAATAFAIEARLLTRDIRPITAEPDPTRPFRLTRASSFTLTFSPVPSWFGKPPAMDLVNQLVPPIRQSLLHLPPLPPPPASRPPCPCYKKTPESNGSRRADFFAKP